MDTNNLLNKNIYTSFAKYVTLNVISMLGVSFYFFADSFFIANSIGKNGLIALNLVLPAYNLMSAVAFMMSMGAGTLFSIHMGEGEEHKAQGVFSRMVVLALAVGAVFALAGLFVSRHIAVLLGAGGELAEMVSVYLRTVYLFGWAYILNNIMVGMVRNDHAPRLAMIAMLTSSFANIILDYIFIYPLNMGIFGAALATGLAPVFGLCVTGIHLFSKHNNLHFAKVKADFGQTLRAAKIGFPSFVSEICAAIVVYTFNLVIIGIIGDVGVAAYGIITNLALILNAVFVGIGQGIQPIVSLNYGAERHRNTFKMLLCGLILAFVLGLIFYTICYIAPDKITAIFNPENDRTLVEITSRGLRLYFTGAALMGLNIVFIAFFASVSNPRPSFIISLLRGIAFVLPALSVLSGYFGISGVWLAVPAAELFTLIAAAFFTRGYSSQIKSVMKKQQN